MIQSLTIVGWILLCTMHAEPATRPSQVDPVARAVQVLTKEARDAIRLKRPFPRTESDYFKKSPAKVDVVKLFEALIRQGPNATIDAYVKWQLISILPDRLALEFERAGTKVLLLAPQIAPLDGSTSTTRDELTRQVAKLSKDEVDLFNQSHETLIHEQRERARIVICYRSEFSARLPIAEQCLKARLDELWTRGSYGLDVEAESKALFADLRTWKSKAGPDQVKQMAATILDYALRPQPFMFDRVEWKPDESRAGWISRNIGLDGAELQNLAIELDGTLANRQK